MSGAFADDVELRQRAQDRFGPWNPVWERAVSTVPQYVQAALDLDGVAERSGHLDAKTRAFIRIALNAAVTHLNSAGLRRALQEALAAGATQDEIFEVLIVASTLSVHGMNADVLAEVLAERGERAGAVTWSAEQERIRDDYQATRGYWRDFLNDTLALAPDFLSAYLDFSGAPWQHGVLEGKTREFIYLAFDTSPTHLHLTGLRIHIHNALDRGAAVGEIIEVMAIAASMGLQTLDLGVSLLNQEVSKAQNSDQDHI